MERFSSFDHDRFRRPGDDLPDSHRLDSRRSEIHGLLQASDHVLDSINDLQAQQYLLQNLQTGGQ